MNGYQESKGDLDNVLDAKQHTGIKKKRRTDLTQERVRELFDYDPETGTVIRKVTVNYRAKAGDTVGSVGNKRGYLYVNIDGYGYRLHRVIWLWIYGYTPEYGVDHINRDTRDNSQTNLREVSQTCNLRNCNHRSDNKTGVKGVSWYRPYNKWLANITIKGRTKRLGYHSDFTEAVAHRLAAEECLKWVNCNSSSYAFQYMQNYLKGLVNAD